MPSRHKLLIATFLGLAACSNSSAGGLSLAPILEIEPNDSMAQAGALRIGQNVEGSLSTLGDSDWWQVALETGDILSVEVFANRFDQDAWVAAANVAKVTLYDTDGTTEILHQDSNAFDWSSPQDTDILGWRVPASGIYFLEFGVEDVLAPGGDYLAFVHKTEFDDLGGGNAVQLETEAAGVGGDNDTDATAEAIVPGVVHGWHVDDETDFYSFTISVPSLVRFTVAEHRNGFLAGDDGLLDPTLLLYDSGMNLVLSNDDAFYLDSALEYLAVSAGTYFIEVTECCNSGDGPYQLTFERMPQSGFTTVAEAEPNDSVAQAQSIAFGDLVAGVFDGGLDYYAVTCNAGDHLNVESIATEGSTFEPSYKILDENDVILAQEQDFGLGATKTILTAAGTYYVVVDVPLRGLTSSYAFRVTQVQAGFESEPNDAIADATPLDGEGRAAGVIDVDGDLDTFSFQGKQNIPVVLDVLASSAESASGFFMLDGYGSILDPAVTVRDANDTVLASWDSTQGYLSGVIDGLPTATLVFVPPANGTYYLQVSQANAVFGAEAFYVVRMRQ